MNRKFRKTFIALSVVLSIAAAVPALGAAGQNPAAPASLSLSQSFILPGKPFTVSGSGFAPDEEVDITAFGSNQTVTTDKAGNFNGPPLQAPMSAADSGYTITALGGTSKKQAKATLTVGSYTPIITASDYFPMPGGKIRFLGAGFAPNEMISVTGPEDSVYPLAISADGSGKFTSPPITVPDEGGRQEFSFTGQDSQAVKTVAITVPNSSYLMLSSYAGRIGTRYRINGFMFKAGEIINLDFQGTRIAQAKTNSRGNFTAIGRVPPQAVNGVQMITATGQSSGRIAQIKFIVNNRDQELP